MDHSQYVFRGESRLDVDGGEREDIQTLILSQAHPLDAKMLLALHQVLALQQTQVYLGED